jgi:hypothetical protein
MYSKSMVMVEDRLVVTVHKSCYEDRFVAMLKKLERSIDAGMD